MWIRKRLLSKLILCGWLMILGSSAWAQQNFPQYQRQDSARFRVLYTGEDAKLIPEFWQTIRQRVPVVEQRIGLALADTVTFVVAPTEREWGRLTAGAPLWANGLAYSERGVAILKSPRFNMQFGRSLPVTAVHEYVHLLLHSGVPSAEIPRWLDEGLAQVLAEQMDYRDDTMVARAAAAGRLFSLRDIEWLMTMPAPDARLGYAESAIAVGWLESRFGMAGLSNLIHELRSGVPFDEAFSTVFQISPGTFNREFNDYVRQNYRLTFLGDTELWVSAMFIILVLAAGMAVLMRRRKTLRRWSEEEGQVPNASAGTPPFTVNYTLVRGRLQERSETNPPEEEPPHDRPVSGN